VRKNILAVVFLAICPLAFAQQVLNNDSIIKMVNAKMSDDLIVNTINAQPGNYDTSTDGLIALKTGGVSDKVVSAIVAKANRFIRNASAPKLNSPAAEGLPKAVSTVPDNPKVFNSYGIYMTIDTKQGEKKMVALRFASIIAGQSTLTLGNAASGGSSETVVEEISGARARFRTSETRPVFYMYFAPSSHPSQLSLVLLEDSKHQRKMRFKAQNSHNIKFDKSFMFSIEKIAPSEYKVIPEEDLSSGEYAFVEEKMSGGMTPHIDFDVFDFGIDIR
jgi:hypothetical protein